jgi:hypothetical protein
MLILFFILTKNAYATTIIFQDDFQTGTDAKWTTLSGNNLWKVASVSGSLRYGARIETGSTIINSMAGDPNWTDYSYDLDVLLTTGVDVNIPVRWASGRDFGWGFCNEFHFNPYIHLRYNDPNIPYNMQSGTAYHIRIELRGVNHKFFINGQKLVDVDVTNQKPPCINGSIGLTISTGSIYPTEVWFDNVVVSTLDVTPSLTLTPAPTTTPTLTPTLTFIPTPTPINLNVPILKQTSSPWGSQIYDSARKWTKDNLSISSWGCALTSGAMILKYHGISLLPNGTVLDPGTLNIWLNSQKDGYVGPGFVNWLSLSRLSKIAKSINGITNFDALEYSRKNTSDINVLKNDINNFTPDIVEEPGHFIVGKGINNGTFNINDPYYNRETLSNGYSNTFLSLGTYTKVNSDLSYVMITTDPSVIMTLTGDAGHSLGESFVQQAMVNDLNSNIKNSPIKIYYLSQPATQAYNLTLTSSANVLTNLTFYLYGRDGTVNVLKENILVGATATNFEINFNKDNLLSSSMTKMITIDDFIHDIIQLKNLKLIHSGFANNLENFTRVIKKDLARKSSKIAKMKLGTLQKVIRITPDILIKNDAKQLLLSDISYLLKSL